MTETNKKLIVLSAGGTGGHMFPAAALARDLLSRGYRVEIITDSRGRRLDVFKGMPVHVIAAGTLRKGLFGKIKGIASAAAGVVQAFRVIDRLRPALVVGFGGYPSVPAVWVAQRRKILTVIHEQNAVMGKANKFLAPKADRIALSLPVSGLADIDNVRTVVTGNPVREEIATLYTRPYPVIDSDRPLNIFVMGGSQGAQVFSDIVPAALLKLPDAQRARLNVVQQCFEKDIEKVRASYQKAGIQARLEAFFTDVPEILAETHLVIARSGASTTAEVTTAGRPAIFVPYPHNHDDQQQVNAEAVADVGGAWVLRQKDFTEEKLLEKMTVFLQNPQTLFEAAEASRSCGRPDAARRLGNLVTALASGWDKETLRPFDITQGREER